MVMVVSECFAAKLRWKNKRECEKWELMEFD
jgi:hypothetical protein